MIGFGDLNVGDKIGVSPGGWDPVCEVRSVTKKTTTQITLDDGSRWTQRGKKVGESSSWHGSFLITVQDAEERNAASRLKRERAMLVNELRNAQYGNLTLEALRELVAALKRLGPQNGSQQK